MKRVKILFVFILMVLSFEIVNAKRGCCSWHGGVSGCSTSGRIICKDGTYSPSCTCTPPRLYGCTDSNAINYNSSANTDNGSCRYEKIEFEDIIIEYEIEIKNPNNIENGRETIIQEGKNGVKSIQYTIIVDSKGNQISKEKGIEIITKQPINQIILIEGQEIESIIEQKKTVEETRQETNIEDVITSIVIVSGTIFGYKKYKKKKKSKTLML